MSNICITAGKLPGEGRITDNAGSYIDFDRSVVTDQLAEWIIAQAWAMHADYRDVWASIDTAVRAAGAWRRDCNRPTANMPD